MPLRRDVINGLRNLFKSGAAYSGLLRYILQQHPGSTLPAEEIRSYFRKAFCISFFNPVKRDVDSRKNDDEYAAIDAWLITDILSTLDTWMPSSTNRPANCTWWESLDLTNPEQFQQGRPSWMSESNWQLLSPTEQQGISTAATSCDILNQKVRVLARLTEQLQRKINELEAV